MKMGKKNEIEAHKKQCRCLPFGVRTKVLETNAKPILCTKLFSVDSITTVFFFLIKKRKLTHQTITEGEFDSKWLVRSGTPMIKVLLWPLNGRKLQVEISFIGLRSASLANAQPNLNSKCKASPNPTDV